MHQRSCSRVGGAIILAAVSLAGAGAAQAVTVWLTHAYGEFVDRGDFVAHISAPSEVVLECPSSVAYQQTGNAITLSVREAPAGQTELAPCASGASVVLGAYAAGEYQVTARIRRQDGSELERTTIKVAVLPIEGRCNPDPALSPSIVGTLRDLPVPQFIARLQADPAFAASLGNPAVRATNYAVFPNQAQFDYPPLEDIAPAMDRLARSGVLASQWRNGWVCFSPSPPDQVAVFLEYYNAALDHYFYTGAASEIAAIDAGKVGPGWARTGESFRAVTVPGCPNASGQTVVYRFNGIPGVGPNSHFFTRDRAECSLVNKAAQWDLEGVPFVASAPNADGTCDVLASVSPPEARVPLYRVWRPFGDSNHRFTTDRAVVAAMVAQGWVDEGPAMCVLPPR